MKRDDNTSGKPCPSQSMILRGLGGADDSASGHETACITFVSRLREHDDQASLRIPPKNPWRLPAARHAPEHISYDAADR
jgi:hypothetical protein